MEGRAASRWRCGLSAVALLLVALPVEAHPVPFSFLDLQRTATGLEASLILHDFDLAHDLGIEPADRLRDPAFLAERASSLRALMTARLQIAADGTTLTTEWGEPEILNERQAIRFPLHFPIAAAPGKVKVTAQMFPYDPTHQTFVNIYEDGELTRQVLLNRNQTSTEHVFGTRQEIGRAHV